MRQWLWLLLFFGGGLIPDCFAESRQMMHIGTLMQISPQHPVVLKVERAYENLGMDMQLETMPLERLRLEAARGVLIDGNLAAAATLQQTVPELIRIPVQLYMLELSAFVGQMQQPPATWADLAKLRVAYMAGMLSVEARLKLHQVDNVIPILTLKQALQYVAKGRADVAILPKAEAEFVLRQLPELRLNTVSSVLEQIPMYHYIHQKHQALVGPLTTQLEQIMAPVNTTGQH